MAWLAHHGVLGMQWGVRRYQNKDGSLTDEGYRHYGYGKNSLNGIPRSLYKPAIKGAVVGSVAGAAIAGSGFIGMLGVVCTTPMLPIAIGATVAGASSGALSGAKVGGLIGAAKTIAGRHWIEKNLSDDLKKFEMRELNSEISKASK